jgi:hypothetical protein
VAGTRSETSRGVRECRVSSPVRHCKRRYGRACGGERGIAGVGPPGFCGFQTHDTTTKLEGPIAPHEVFFPYGRGRGEHEEGAESFIVIRSRRGSASYLK